MRRKSYPKILERWAPWVSNRPKRSLEQLHLLLTWALAFRFRSTPYAIRTLKSNLQPSLNEYQKHRDYLKSTSWRRLWLYQFFSPYSSFRTQGRVHCQDLQQFLLESTIIFCFSRHHRVGDPCQLVRDSIRTFQPRDPNHHHRGPQRSPFVAICHLGWALTCQGILGKTNQTCNWGREYSLSRWETSC